MRIDLWMTCCDTCEMPVSYFSLTESCVQLLAEDPGRFADADDEEEEAKGKHPNGLPKTS